MFLQFGEMGFAFLLFSLLLFLFLSFCIQRANNRRQILLGMTTTFAAFSFTPILSNALADTGIILLNCFFTLSHQNFHVSFSELGILFFF